MNYEVTYSGDPELAKDSANFMANAFGGPTMSVEVNNGHHHHNNGNAEISFNGGFGGPTMTMEVTDTSSHHHHHHSNSGNVNVSFGALGGIANAVVGMANAVVATTGLMIDGRNRIWVQLNQSSYIGGDIVSGTVEMDCIVPFFAKGVIVKVKGFERLWLQELRTETEGEGSNKRTVYKTIDHKENKEFFKSTIVVYPQSGTVNCGHYSFPFSYQLPAELPGTFCHDGKDAQGAYSAKILYKCKATVDVAHKHDLKSTTKLIINEKCGELVKPSFSENKKSFMLTKGKLHVKTWLNKNAYFPGETLIAKIKANNTSIKPTRKISIKVHHKMELKTRLYHRCINNVIFKQEYEGFQPCFYGKRYLPFAIPVELKPSSSMGKHVTSSYILELECDIPMAIDLSVNLPLTLFAPQFLYSTVPSQPPGTPLPPDVSYRHPWESDEHQSSCRKCNKQFGLFARKHHCRHCMKIFCDKCTATKTTISKLAYPKPVRVCEECYPVASQGGHKYQSAKVFAPQYQASLNAYYSQYAQLYPQIYPTQSIQPSAPPSQF